MIVLVQRITLLSPGATWMWQAYGEDHTGDTVKFEIWTE